MRELYLLQARVRQDEARTNTAIGMYVCAQLCEYRDDASRVNGAKYERFTGTNARAV